MSSVRAMQVDARTKYRFCDESTTHAAKIYNQTATPVLNIRTSMEGIIGRASNNWKHGTFGWDAFMHKHKKDHAGKIDNRSETDMYLSTA